jgi:hypothetical protein
LKTKISKILITLLVVTLGTVYANNQTTTTVKSKDYTQMSTTQLQIAVEKLSNEGNLPSEMGFELMRRWTESKKEVN